MAKQPTTHYTAAEYLTMERASSEKHEFADGEIFAMTGSSLKHNEIAQNISGGLRTQFRDRTCRVFTLDVRVCVHPDYRYTYPDVVVVCGEPKVLDDKFDTLLNPTLIVEVLSESTRNYDRGDKFQQYRDVVSFCEYLLVDQDKVHIELFTKQTDGRWTFWETNSIEAVVPLESVGASLRVSEIYSNIDFD